MPLLSPGQQIARYTILGKLATGGMSELYIARQTGPSGFAKTLVLKVILPNLADDQQLEPVGRPVDSRGGGRGEIVFRHAGGHELSPQRGSAGKHSRIGDAGLQDHLKS